MHEFKAFSDVSHGHYKREISLKLILLKLVMAKE